MIFFDSEDDYRTGCRKVSHCQQQQSYSGLRSSGRSNSTYFCYDFYCSIDSAQKSECYNFPTTSYLVCFSSAQWPLCSWTTGNLSFFIELLCLTPWFSWVHSTVGSHQVFIKPAVSLAVYLRFLKLFTASIISFFSFCLFCKTSC